MKMIKLSPKDIHPLDAFAPQDALNTINRRIKEKIKEICQEKGHVWELYKRGEVSSLEFESLAWAHRCRFCETELNPIAFEEVRHG
jgi:aspartate carbamoyltransferase regulatory subunit